MKFRDLKHAQKFRKLRSLDGEIFVGDDFERLEFPRGLSVSNLVIRDAVISHNIFQVLSASTSLIDCHFENVLCKEFVSIDSCCVLRGIVFSGERTRGIKVIQREDQPHNESDEVFLDIRKFIGEISIFGWNASNVLINPERHIVLQAGENKNINIPWEELSIDSDSWWQECWDRAQFSNTSVYFCSVPESNGDYEQELTDLEKLRAAGYFLPSDTAN